MNGGVNHLHVGLWELITSGELVSDRGAPRGASFARRNRRIHLSVRLRAVISKDLERWLVVNRVSVNGDILSWQFVLWRVHLTSL